MSKACDSRSNAGWRKPATQKIGAVEIQPPRTPHQKIVPVID
jgi:hypothetical protein